MTSTFSTLGIRPELVEQLNKHGVTQPTPIQEQSIPTLLHGQDVIAQAQTGTGKTLAFVLPMLERIDATNPAVQALVITPTRELALQITDEVRKLAPTVGAKVLAAYGGQDVEAQIHKLRGAIHLVIGTPGRLLDHLRRGTVDFRHLTMLVLDEADQMLHMGFLHEVERIIEQAAEQRQTMLFSATMPPQIRSVAARYMQHPVEIRVQSQRITLDEIEQVVIETSDRFKQEALCKMIDQYNPYLAIIFCRTKRRASKLNEDLLALGYDADELHGDLSQAKREKVLKRFREAKIQLLVATDVAARGLDVEGVTHVFNYDIPQDVESYIHRIGRTGRAGERGVAVTFVAPKDRAALQLIETGIKRKIAKRTANGQKVPERAEKADAYAKERTTQKRGGRTNEAKTYESRNDNTTRNKKRSDGPPRFTSDKRSKANGRYGERDDAPRANVGAGNRSGSSRGVSRTNAGAETRGGSYRENGAFDARSGAPRTNAGAGTHGGSYRGNDAQKTRGGALRTQTGAGTRGGSARTNNAPKTRGGTARGRRGR